MSTASGASNDGRSIRSSRTREAIAVSMAELIAEGHIGPTALEIAQRAHVSARTIYVHFKTMEDLYAEIVRKQTILVLPLLLALDPQLDTETKSISLITMRDSFYSQAAPLRNSIMFSAAVSDSETIRGGLQMLREAMMTQVRQSFVSELLLKPEPHLSASRIEAVTSFEMWDHLHRIQGCSRNATRAQMHVLLRAELFDGDSGHKALKIGIDGLASFGA